MALQGTLKDFGIADIFQLIGQQQKTGILVLSNGPNGSAVDVFFAKGMICRAAPHGVDEDSALYAALIRGGLITKTGAEESARLAREQLRRLRDVLVDSGLIVNEQVAASEKLDTLENIYDLFGWQDANFQFDQKDVQVNEDSFRPVPAEHVLMDGFRMVDEWPSVLKELPDFSRQVSPSPGLEIPPPVDNAEKRGGVSHDEFRVYEAIGTGRSIQSVIDLARLGKFDGAKAILSLVKKGYVRLDSRSEPEAFTPGTRKAKPWEGRGPSFAALTVAAILVLWGLPGIYRFATWPIWSAEIRARERLSLFEARINHALDAYHALQNEYPEKLSDLVTVGLISPETVQFMNGLATYQRAGEHYDLVIRRDRQTKAAP